MGMTNGQTERVADAMDAQRAELGIKWSDVAKRADMSVKTLERFRNGKLSAYSRGNIRAIERALGWERGSIDAIRNGGEPTLTGDTPADIDLRDDIERQIWAISELEEDLRWSYIYMRRAKIDAEQQRGQGRMGQTG